MTLPTSERQRARRSSPTGEPLGAGLRYDYADAFEVALGVGDNRTAEQVVRTGLEDAPRALRLTVLIAHRHVLRFRLGPASSPNHVMGWQVVTAEPNLCRLEARGPLIAGTIVARRVDAVTTRLTTFVRYERPAARVVWAMAGPVHRRIAPYLMVRAAIRPAELA